MAKSKQQAEFAGFAPELIQFLGELALNLGVQFRHAAGKDVHAPGLYRRGGSTKTTPHIEDLERKDHIAVCNLSHDDIYGPKMLERTAERFAASKPYMKFLCAALDVPF